MNSSELEEGSIECLDWKKLQSVAATDSPVLPVAVQDEQSGAVLIVAYVNKQALEESSKRGIAVFWSTSRNELWVKGATSGNTLELVEVPVNCEQNSLLYRVRMRESQGSCHTFTHEGGSRFGCYYRRLKPSGELEMANDQGAYRKHLS